MDLQIITTKDGSHSLFNSGLNETYHSIHGAVQESTHVFIKAGLDFVVEKLNHAPVQILEVGFGTGLNALLTVMHAAALKNKIQYTSLETFPLGEDVWSKLNYADATSIEYFKAIHTAPWQICTPISSNVDLLKMDVGLEEIALHPNYYDLIFYDAFAPAKQPAMWQLPVLEKIAKSMKTGAVYVTYCAKGQLKRDLKSLGLSIESLPGPPGKMEMVRATKN